MHNHFPLASRVYRPEFIYPLNFGWISIGVFLFLIAFVRHGVGAEISFAWDAVNDARLGGYELKYGSSSGSYNTMIDVGNTTGYIVTGLNAGNTYFFCVRAYSQDKSHWSSCSNEISSTAVLVGNQSPLANAGGPYSASQGESVTFNGTDSSDPDGEITAYAWEFGDGSTGTGSTPTHTYLSTGTFTSTLTVTDNEGASSTTTATVTIQAVYPTPVASFDASKISGIARLTVTFTDTSTGIIDSRDWDFGDGGTSTGSTAVYTFTSAGTYTVTLTASGPGGSNEATKTILVSVPTPAPTASFTMSQTSGFAPLTVVFANASTGDITDYDWDFGDGGTSTEASPSYTFYTPGNYDVILTATGPGGSDSATMAVNVVVIEVGEIALDHEWARVDFQQPFADPVVIVNALSGNGGDPAVVRIEGVDSDGFWVRIQEWDYLDGWHTMETVSFIVIESGVHQLPDGEWIEAGRLEISTDDGFFPADLAAPFTNGPVILASITTINETEAVTTRLRNIDPYGFQIKLQEQEGNQQEHTVETIDYIAWEPSSGIIDGQRFEVGRTADQVKHKAHTIDFTTGFESPPFFLANMQTTDGGDTANLRCLNNTSVSIDVWVDEEQSRGREISHTTEIVGYIALTTDN